MRHGEVTLDPHNVDTSLYELSGIYDLPPDDLDIVRRVIALYPHPTQMYLDEANAILHESIPLGDKFSFDTQRDELILYTREKETLIDALIEMAMYLVGFTTMLGTEDTWVIEFTIGAWKPVKKHIKRQLDIPTSDHPRGVVGLPPSAQNKATEDVYPFRRLVSQYDLASFHQMILLAARDDIAVYFPPETHPKVLAVYVYMRRAMQEVAQGINLEDYEMFNTRLVNEVQRLEKLFDPASLTLPTWLRDRHSDDAQHPLDHPNLLSEKRPVDPPPSPQRNPFEAFIEQLFTEDENPDQDANA